jgi:predicted ATPase
MLHLAKIRLRNALRDIELEIAPLTFLLGSNSAGKSSLVQAMKLLTTSVQSGGNSVFPLNGELASLGTFKEVKNSLAHKDATIGIEFHFGKAQRAKILQTIENPIATTTSNVAHYKLEIEGGPSASQARVRKLNMKNADVQLALASQQKGSNYEVSFLQSVTGDAPKEINDLIYKPFEYVSFIDGVMNTALYLNDDDRYEWWEGQYQMHLREGLNRGVSTLEHLIRLFSEYFEREYPEAHKNEADGNRTSLDDYLAGWEDLRDSSGQGDFTVEDWAFAVENDLQYRLSLSILDLLDEEPSGSSFSKSLGSIIKAAYLEQLERHRPPLAYKGEEELAEALHRFMLAQELDEQGVFFAPVQLEYDKGNSDVEYGPIEPSDYQSLSEIQSFVGKKIKFLGPLRIDGFAQQKSESAPNPALPVGIAGELTAQKVMVDPKRSYSQGRYPMPDSGYEDSLIVALNSWISHIEIGQLLSTQDLGSRGVSLAVDGQEIHQLGTGVSQVLPVLVACLSASAGDVVVIEQPELHLHPAAQQKLADFFMAIVSSGAPFSPRLIVETHSEYFINRLRRGVVLGTFSPENSTIAFFEKDKDGTKVRQMAPSASGGFDDWPAGFFAQTEDDLLDILQGLEALDEE